ncbi:hypothetical protein A2592_03500 [Candidatus Kaiserbacteria bacterium RIFOXYD1_FULL_42_15]|uniref:Uncharacterized protein n=1 Tax=Candidatus Kaiserbacteria bacterium RIFOXYD1_FULL_42_15 TaxID=1798532 RepID=A0A1F6FPI2_9BACT|nr:MAG: hypothetical protein A2592_03500 [Candidatus Kaiserbacteria bacterium RIFOXYD1_FULL_42_15]
MVAINATLSSRGASARVTWRSRVATMTNGVDCRAVARLSAMPALHTQAWHAGQAGKDVTFPYSIFYFPLPFFIFFVIFFPLRKKIISF